MTVHKVIRGRGDYGEQIEAEVSERGVHGTKTIMVDLKGEANLNRGQWETFAQEVSSQISKLVTDREEAERKE